MNLINFDQGIKRMNYNLKENMNAFRDERIALKRLKVNDGNEQRKDLFFIKGEILDLSQKFISVIGS